MAQTLEQTLTALAAQHDLTSIQIGCGHVGDRVYWKACIHWDGYSQRDIACRHGRSNNSIADAVYKAIEAARPDRLCPIKVGALAGFQSVNDVHLDRAA
jgi:saccharopine dehydrogenase-like NADP-dependent oxidoreductase